MPLIEKWSLFDRGVLDLNKIGPSEMCAKAEVGPFFGNFGPSRYATILRAVFINIGLSKVRELPLGIASRTCGHY